MKTFYHEDSAVIDPMMYSQFIKYDKLINPLRSMLPKPDQDKLVNVFIDLYSMTTILYRFYRFENPLSLTSCMVNAGIHYRNIFKKLGVYSNIFLVYSPTMSANNIRYCPEYNSTNIMSYMNNHDLKRIIEENLQLMKIMVPYLPDIYFKYGTVEVPVIMTDIITKFANKGFKPPTLVVSSNPISFQIPCLCDNVKVLCQRHNKDVYEVRSDNALAMAAFYNSPKHKQVLVDQTWVAGYYTLSRVSKRDIKALAGTSAALNMLSTIYHFNNALSAESLYMAFLDKYKLNLPKGLTEKTLLDAIHNRFKCFDFHHQLALYSTMPESKEKAFLAQLQDQDELLRINEKYLRSNPINFDML